MIAAIKSEVEIRINKTLESLRLELGKLRTGRAHPGLLESVRVTVYGNESPLKHVADIRVRNSKTLTVTPWDKDSLQTIVKAILASDLDLNPAIQGNEIWVPLPAVTSERRLILVKQIKKESENTKVSIRNHRRDANDKLKDLVKEKNITEDEEKRGQELIQKIIDHAIREVDNKVMDKEKELLKT